jgi:hypothetical protein
MLKGSKTEKVTPHVAARSRTMVVERIAPTVFRVTPAESGKVPRNVRFHLEDEDAYIECYSAIDLTDCPANAFNRHCSHVESCIKFLLGVE